jgi:predicted permease
MENLLRDIKFAFRFLKRNSALTVIVSLTLALGIGANTAIFSIVNAVLLRPLPFKDPEQIMLVWETFPKMGADQIPASAPNFFDWKEQNRSFEDLAATFSMPEYGFNLVINGAAERVPGGKASANLLSVLGLQPVLGRSFLPDEDRPGGEPVVMVSHRLWKQRLGANPAVVGQKILVDSLPCTLVGVLPLEMEALGSIDVWVPTALNRSAPRDDHIVGVLGRLKTGVLRQRAQDEMRVIQKRIAQEMKVDPENVGIRVQPLGQFYSGMLAPALIILQTAVGILLLIACANVASLLLARAISREQEIAIRVSLGAGRGRLIRQLLTESVLLASLGGVLGLLLAGYGIGLLRSALPDLIPRLKSMSIDPYVLLFNIGISILTGILFGLVPAWKASRQDLANRLKAGADKLAGSRSGQRTRSLLLTAEIAMTLILAISAGLLVKSFWKLATMPPGFRSDHLLTLGLNFPASKYQDPLRQRAFMQSLLDQLGSLPGVQSAAAISLLPLRNSFLMSRNNVAGFAVEGHPEPRPGERPNADFRFVTPGFFDTMRIPVLQGRSLNEMDTPDHPRVVLINEALARQHFPKENPVGRRIRFLLLTSDPCEIVGVVGDVKLGTLAAPVEPAIYLAFAQQPRLIMSVVVRTDTNPTALAATVRREIFSLDSELPVSDLQTMETVISNSLLPQRLAVALMTSFAVFALLLGIVGIYGLTSLLVSQRTRELGIRMALGAPTAEVLRLILQRGVLITLVGTSLGLVGALALTRGMTGLLYGVAAHDPWIFAGFVLLMIGVSLISSLIPAWRVTRINPMRALRYE